MNDPGRAGDPTGWWEAECAAVRTRPAARTWDEETVELAVDEADRDAENCLKALWETHGRRPAEDYLKDFGLTVVSVGFSDPWPRPYFAIYDSGDMTIEVNLRLIRDVSRHLRATGRGEWVADDKLRKVAIAHELYHHLVFAGMSSDATPESSESSEVSKRPSLRDRWKNRAAASKQAARQEIIEEIAAVRFSQLMNGLDFSPLAYTEAAMELDSLREAGQNVDQGGDEDRTE